MAKVSVAGLPASSARAAPGFAEVAASASRAAPRVHRRRGVRSFISAPLPRPPLGAVPASVLSANAAPTEPFLPLFRDDLASREPAIPTSRAAWRAKYTIPEYDTSPNRARV